MVGSYGTQKRPPICVFSERQMASLGLCWLSVAVAFDLKKHLSILFQYSEREKKDLQ